MAESEEKRAMSRFDRDGGRILINHSATAAAIARTPPDAKDPHFDQHQILPNLIAFVYIFTAYGLGLHFVLTGDAFKRWLFGVPLLAHGMTMAGYMVHECAHETIVHFKQGHTLHLWAVRNKQQAHAVLGNIMTWICGAAYTPFHVLQDRHVDHHNTTVDVLTFDFQALLNHPSVPGRAFRAFILAQEWAYIPAVEWMMHGFMMIAPFVRLCQKRWYRRVRVVSILLARIGLFIWITREGDRFFALAAYLLSYSILLQILRFGDCFQHTYNTVVADPKSGKAPIGDERINRAEEQAKTFSPLVLATHTPYPPLPADKRVEGVEAQASEGFLRLACDFCNLVLHLNFGYHNAHHSMPTVPWHSLPHRHRTSVHSPVYNEQTLALSTLLRLFHIYRVERVLATSYGKTPGEELKEFIGAVGVSFLTNI